MDSEFKLVARAIDEHIKFMETKLEKPYMIGFNHSDAPAKEAEKIVDDLLKEINEMIGEQKEIETFLQDEINALEVSNEDFSKFLADSQSQLQEFETYACSNVPGYQKFVPPAPRDDYIVTDPNELPMELNATSPRHTETDEIDNLAQSPIDAELGQDIQVEDNNDAIEAEANQLDEHEFDHRSSSGHNMLYDESQIDMVASPLVEADHFKPVVAKKLDFDQVTIGVREMKPMACSTEKKNKVRFLEAKFSIGKVPLTAQQALIKV